MNDQNPSNAPHDILIAEFEYLAGAAQQANEDRARVTQYYFMTLGSVIASLLSLKEIQEQYLGLTYTVLMLIFAMFVGLGILTVEQLVRLRLSWLKSTLAMDVIKEYYIKYFPEAAFARAISLRIDNLPDAFQWFSISHLLSIATSFLSAVSLVIALAFYRLAWFNRLVFDGMMVAGFWGVFLGEQIYYFIRLRNARFLDEVDEAKKRFGEQAQIRK